MGELPKAVRLPARLYRAQETARTLLRDRYVEAVGPYRELLRQRAAELAGYIPAFTDIAKCAKLKGMDLLCLMAALVDELEESNHG